MIGMVLRYCLSHFQRALVALLLPGCCSYIVCLISNQFQSPLLLRVCCSDIVCPISSEVHVVSPITGMLFRYCLSHFQRLYSPLLLTAYCSGTFCLISKEFNPPLLVILFCSGTASISLKPFHFPPVITGNLLR